MFSNGPLWILQEGKATTVLKLYALLHTCFDNLVQNVLRFKQLRRGVQKVAYNDKNIR